jgi:hypothetical protein
MAQKVQFELISDLALAQDPESRAPAARTVSFSIDGESYEIDLSEGEAQELEEKLAPYMIAGRRRGRAGGTRARTALKAARKSVDTVAVRDWARENGIEVKDRGRVPADVVARYEAAQRA